jgi:glycosyltransferase involved in cell wall biosynthesis
VTFVGEVGETEAGDLMERCRAMVFCAEEDFGIAPVEANAHGLPVVAYRRGGAVESLRAGVTAEFFDEPTSASLVEALERARRRDWDDVAIRANAERFSADRFRAGIADQVALLYGRGPAPIVALAVGE